MVVQVKKRGRPKNPGGPAPRPRRMAVMLTPAGHATLSRVAAKFGREKRELAEQLLQWFEAQDHWTQLWVLGLLGPLQGKFDRTLRSAAEALGLEFGSDEPKVQARDSGRG